MSLLRELAELLAGCTPGGYTTARAAYCSEPTALAAMAHVAAGRPNSAARACAWLARVQGEDGSVGVTSDQPEPRWPTALAMLAWHRWQQVTRETLYNTNIERGMKFALEAQGRTAPRKPEVGHDTTLLGWSWAEHTHSWLEPTAFFVRAGFELGLSKHPRFHAGVQLLVDRQLPSGGCNYGNTIVLGQELLPHVQPTGIAMWALGATNIPRERVAKTLDYLSDAIDARTSSVSLAWAVLGLAAHQRLDNRHIDLLVASAQRLVQMSDAQPTYPLALTTLALASLGESAVPASLATHPASAS